MPTADRSGSLLSTIVKDGISHIAVYDHTKLRKNVAVHNNGKLLKTIAVHNNAAYFPTSQGAGAAAHLQLVYLGQNGQRIQAR